MNTEPSPTANCLPAELVARAAFLLGRIGLSVKEETMERFEQAGFSAYQYGILALLEEGSRVSQTTIADALAFDKSMLVGLLDQLEEKGLIERRRDPNDRRRQMVSLTPAGKHQLEAFRGFVRDIEDEFLAPLDED
ncbi:MAG: winged helix-turn-helix transcriptional regulator, partial [Actinobacteria bacterium]|nr:winged helix-turn-helix transcriptional regulator [Actinomycetota bacterium]